MYARITHCRPQCHQNEVRPHCMQQLIAKINLAEQASRITAPSEVRRRIEAVRQGQACRRSGKH